MSEGWANPRLSRNVLGLRYLDEEERIAVLRWARSFLDVFAYRERERPCNSQT
ncbi:MAG: hypothetical protein JXM73_17400 [Anaerolineae bacterium]|nr:hypothetical protein [Anaerolineae bacterium]